MTGKSLVLLAFTAMLITACEPDYPYWEEPDEPYVPSGPTVPSVKPGTYNLPLIETTDIHGYIINTDNNSTHYRMAYVADKVKDIRGHKEKYDKGRLLLLDGGDLYQGASISNLQSGRPVYVAMDVMEYDAVALGNHEFDWEVETLVEKDATLPDYERNGKKDENPVPVVCANLYRNGSRVPWTKDYVIVEKDAVNSEGGTVTVKIGIVGFATDYASSILTSKFTGEGYSIKEDYSAANSIAASLESSGQCDATILLIHGAAGNAANKLGQGSSIDLVLGGHSHQTASGRTGWGLPYLQGGRYCEHYAYADLKFTVAEDGSVSFSGVKNLSTPSVDATRDLHDYAGQNAEDLEEDILNVSEEAINAVAQQMNEVIGYIDVNATSYYINGSGERSAVISNWMCDLLRRIGNADVAFVNGGGVRTSLPLNGKSKRDITVSTVYEMFPFGNTTYVYSITYAELLKVLEYSMTSAGSSLFSRVTGIDCYFSNYTVRSIKKNGSVIYQNKSWTGNWASRGLIMATNEYIATNQRVDNYTGLSNPLPEWNNSSRLIGNTLVDNENAVIELRKEAKATGGHLYVDTAPHFILAN